MATLADLFLIEIHGFPLDSFSDSHEQLASLRKGLFDSFPDLAQSHDVFVWCNAQTYAQTIYQLMRDPSALEKLCEQFKQWLHDRDLDGHTLTPKRLFVLTYSTGGALFYKWVTEAANHANLVEIAVTIAAPYQNPGHVRFEGHRDGRPILIKPFYIDPQTIVSALAPNSLMVLLAESDITVLRPDSVFTAPPLTKDELLRVRQHTVAGTRHHTIQASDTVREYIRDFVNSRLTESPHQKSC
jgi:hypothetical protein